MKDDGASKVSYLMIGLGIGAALGILFAPQSGEDTRAFLTSKADEGRRYAKDKAQALRATAGDLVDRGKEVISRQSDSFGEAVEIGKDAYRREKSKGAASS